MRSAHGFAVGDTVELRDAAGETIGTIVTIAGTHATVEWTAGQGLAGQRTMVPTSALKTRPAKR